MRKSLLLVKSVSCYGSSKEVVPEPVVVEEVQ